MSDTDDTDDLLLIPPDFFILHSDGEDSTKAYGPYYKVVDSLITQVIKLEDRVNSIETGSDSSLRSNSLDFSFDNSKRRKTFMSEIRKYNSLENIPNQDVYPGSTQSTPQKPRTKIKLKSLPSTPSSTERYVSRRRDIHSHYGEGDRSSISHVSPNKKHPLHTNIPRSTAHYNDSNYGTNLENDDMLSEIDNFISNVKTIKRFNAARNLDKEFDSHGSINNSPPASNVTDINDRSGLSVNDIDHLLHTMESHQRLIESRLKEKEHELGLNKNIVSENFKQNKTWQPGESKDSVPDRGMGMRDTMYKELVTNKSTANKNTNAGKLWERDIHQGFVQEPEVQSRNISSNEQQKNKEAGSSKNHVHTLTVSALGTCEPSISDLSARNTESVFSDTPSLSSSDSTQITAYHNQQSQGIIGHPNNGSPDSEKIHTKAVEILNLHRNLLQRDTGNIPEYGDNKEKKAKLNVIPRINSSNSQYDVRTKLSNAKSESRNTLALLSLSELWNQSTLTNDSGRTDYSKFLNKLQEERLRRQHCEQLIQQLQTRTLELQERIAVAVQVDKAKDEAILHIHKSWEESAGKIKILNKEITILEQQIDELKSRMSHELSDAAKKVDHYENESSKALNLAHSNQERLAELEKQNEHLSRELRVFDDKLKTTEMNYNEELNNNQQLSKILSQKEIELTECKNVLSEARKEVAQSKRAVELCQTELTSMKSSQTHWEQQIDEKLERIRELEKEKTKLLGDLEMHKKIEKNLKDDLSKQKEMIEKNKVELKNFYQEQVEVVVREKLREFQAQLEKAENSLQDEIRKRELSVAKAAAIHIQQISEKHSLEVHLLEEKHKEEIKLYKLQLSQSQQQIENMHVKLQQQQERKANVAQQLHNIMEAQWLEAIKIINDGKSPVVSQDKGTNTMDKLNYLKSRSYNNLEEILFKDELSDGENSYDHITQMYQAPLETPIGRPQKNRQQMENELQKYVQMLLDKSPGYPIDEKSTKYHEKQKSQPPDYQMDDRSSNSYWQQTDQCDKLNFEGIKSSKTNTRERMAKPPWK